MPKRGESSLFRSLAVALGEGLAFSTGMNITDGMARQFAPQDGALAERVEKRIDGAGHPPMISTAEDAPFDQKVVDAMVPAWMRAFTNTMPGSNAASGMAKPGSLWKCCRSTAATMAASSTSRMPPPQRTAAWMRRLPAGRSAAEPGHPAAPVVRRRRLWLSFATR
jgi:hypothetical protein